MPLKDHLSPIFHQAIGNFFGAAILAVVTAILAVAVTFLPSIRSVALEAATTLLPLWSVVVLFVVVLLALVPLLAVFLVRRRAASRTVSARAFFRNNDVPADLPGRLRSARKAAFWGTAFVKFIPLLRDELEARLKAGSHIQFLLIDPEGTALPMANLRGRPEDIPNRKADLLRSLATLSSLAQNGTLECKVIDYLAPYAMVILDADDRDKAHMYIWLATLGVPNQQRPMFELSCTSDSHWFAFFAEQFRLTWEKAVARPSSSA